MGDISSSAKRTMSEFQPTTSHLGHRHGALEGHTETPPSCLDAALPSVVEDRWRAGCASYSSPQPVLTRGEDHPEFSKQRVHGKGDDIEPDNDGVGPHTWAAEPWRGMSTPQSAAHGGCNQNLLSRDANPFELAEQTQNVANDRGVERYRVLPKQDLKYHSRKQRDWLKVIARIFPWIARRRAARERMFELEDLHKPPPSPPDLTSPPFLPASLPSVWCGTLDCIATSSAPAEIPPAQNHLRPPSVTPVGMSAASAMASFQGVGHANVHGGTFYAAQTINIIVSPPYHAYAPLDLASGPHPLCQSPVV
ncbi:hypothetical protein BKA70DRAFT_122540 [Coprinopsis sp. MPI-PUGE-AT-0042]|nr:hypothetical protein BKA70DRAFT_122540 [Coprinopsis sp. MPI-PUGE-AT-0042]